MNDGLHDILNIKFPVMEIVRGTIVDGPGFRTSIYFAGCKHRCVGCHNPQSWEIKNAKSLFSIKELIEIIEEENFDVTLSGGDPLFHYEFLPYLNREIKLRGKNLWIYTGYTWEEIMKSNFLFHAIKDADVLVDGRFDESTAEENIRFRGSGNQRIIDIQSSIKKGRPILWQE